jgi:hypothetical protein
MESKQPPISKSVLQHVSDFFLKRPITIKEDREAHRKVLLRSFLATTIYAIAYGIYEYFIVKEGIGLEGLLGLPPQINWIIMYIGIIALISAVTFFNIEQTINGLLYFVMFEDVIYWMCQWVHTGRYPFPAGNWWDSYFASFKVLGGLGQALPFFPYVPFYYIPGFTMVIAYYACAFYRPLTSRISAWIIGPLFLAILGGALLDPAVQINLLIALIILIALPTASYSYAGGLFLWRRRSGELTY